MNFVKFPSHFVPAYMYSIYSTAGHFHFSAQLYDPMDPIDGQTKIPLLIASLSRLHSHSQPKDTNAGRSEPLSH
jgi:hypothetical protein